MTVPPIPPAANGPGSASEDALFGKTLIREGLLSADQLRDALKAQASMKGEGVRLRLGEVLVQKKWLTPEQVREILKLVGKQLLHCPQCGKNYNVKNWAPGKEVFCPACSVSLVPPASDSTLDAHDTRIVPHEAGAQSAQDTEGKPFGRYRLLQELGRGGMGIVWKAWDTQLKRIVALKGLLSSGQGSEAQIERFMREARLAAKLKHPHIVAVHDVGSHEGEHFFTTDFVPAQSLDVLMRKSIPAKQAVTWIHTVAEALAYAHQEGVVHRDIKPANILIDGKGQPFVMDFGLAKEVEVGGEGQGAGGKGPALTISGALLGTPVYMSPEQASGRADRIGPAGDQFSLAVVLYELLTGRRPFEAESLRTLLNQIAEKDPVPLRRIKPRIHRDIETICLRALEKDPRKRYPTMGDFAADLWRYLDGESIQARPVSLAGRLTRKAVKHRAIVIPTAAAVVLGVGFGAYLLVAHRIRSGDIAAGLETGRRLRTENSPREARDAFQKVLALDGENAEALDGAVWSERELSARARQAEAETQSARAGEAAAREIVRKAGLVQNVMTRWLAVEDALRAIEELHYDETRPEPERREMCLSRWPPIDEFVHETPGDSTSQAAALALAGWARCLAMDAGTGAKLFSDSSAADADVPLADLLQALTLFSDYLADCPLPPVLFMGFGIELAPVRAESARLRNLRERIDGHLAAAARKAVWGEGLAREFQKVIGGMRAVQASRFDEAEALLTDALGSGALQTFRSDLLLARAKVRFFRGAHAEAAADVEKVLARRPRDSSTHFHLGNIGMGIAAACAVKGGDPEPAYRKALASLDESHRLRPRDVRPLTARGLVRVALRELPEAVKDLTEAHTLDPDDPLVLLNRGLARSDLGEFDAAIADFDAALAIVPRFTLALVDRGSAWLSKGEIDRAIADYDAALNLQPGHPQAHYNRAVARQWKGDLKGAAEDCSAAIAGRPYALALKLRADLREDLDDFSGAAADYTEALVLRPDWIAALWRRSELRRRMGDSAGADQDVQACLKAVPTTPEGLAGRAHVRCVAGDVAGALADCEAAIRMDPRNGSAHQTRGSLRFNAGDARGALADFDAAIRLAGPSARLLSHRGSARGTLGDLDGAISDFTAALIRSPSYAEALANRGFAHVQKGDLDAALRDLDAALRIRPRDGFALYNRGRVHRSRGNLERALADFDAALEIDPGDTESLHQRGLVRVQRGNLPGALEDLSEEIRRRPRSASPIISRGEVKIEMGDLEGAVEDFTTADRLEPDGLWPPLQRSWARRNQGECEKALADLEEAGKRARSDKDWQAVEKYYVCLYALRSAGLRHLGAKPQTVKPEEAARFRDLAFEHLQKYLERGGSMPMNVEAVKETQPLESDPRWKAMTGGKPK